MSRETIAALAVFGATIVLLWLLGRAWTHARDTTRFGRSGHCLTIRTHSSLEFEHHARRLEEEGGTQ